MYNIVPWWRYLGYRLSHSIFHTLYCRLHRRYYNRSVTNSFLTNCVDRSLFPSTLLTVHYSRWRPTIHRRLSALAGWLSRLTALRRRRRRRLQLPSPALSTGSLPDCNLTTVFAGSLHRLSSWLQTDYCLRRLAHRLSSWLQTDYCLRRLSPPALFLTANWLLSSPAGPPALSD
jgi:hypothetical protein